jgi:type IV pilus assembly protein PilW
MMTPAHPRRAVFGFSLIELLVSMVIALVVTLAISSVMIQSEGSKRANTSLNDVNQTGAYLAFVLDRSIRSAGSGFGQRWNSTYGCVLDASSTTVGHAVLPLPAAASAPFAHVSQTFRLAPVLIDQGMADEGSAVRGDVITVMGGTSGVGEVPGGVASVTTNTVRLPNTVGYQVNDLVLLADNTVAAGCLLEQVSAVSTDTLTFGGNYASAGHLVNVTGFGTSSVLVQLGRDAVNPPQFMMYGVGDNSTLYSYELLQMMNTGAVPVADGVIEMRALYGVDTGNPLDGKPDVWIDPVVGSGYAHSELTDGSQAAQTRLRRIVAIRVGLFMRTSLKERVTDRYPGIAPGTLVSSLPPVTLKLFGDLGTALQKTRTISGDDLLYRYRTVEFTVPLRNVTF